VDPTARLVAALRRGLGPRGGAGRGLVVAVSGGPDSVALARAAVLARGPGAAPLVLAHLNHGLRGADSDADEAFVTGLHARLAAGVPGLELCRERLDVAAEARRAGANLEATARRLRYRWLAEVARARGIPRVATGHTADDQAETVLHRLLRGAGLAGLRGIAARRPLAPGVVLVRPLLAVTRADVLSFLRELGQPYREDASNRDPRLTRSRIRHELLPHLRDRYNPAVARALTRLAAQAGEAFRDEEAAARRLLAEAERPRAGGRVVLGRAALAAAPRRLARAALRLVWRREGWPLDAMGHAGWERLAGLLRGESRALDLPGHVRAEARPRVVLLGRCAPPTAE
jgi:tRNA(Ile)-lysidine synthase